MQIEEKVSPETRRETVRKLLEEPVMLDFTEPVRKMRTHLLLGSCIGVAVGWYDLTIESSSGVFGVQLKGLTPQALQWGLFWVVLYLFVHFVWSSWDLYLEWKVRQTGQKRLHKRGTFAGPLEIEIEKDPSQSTLYSWWYSSSKNWARRVNAIPSFEKDLTNLVMDLKTRISTPQETVDHVLANQVESLLKTITGFRETQVEALKVLDSPRIVESLARFDKSFWRHAKSQQWRWIVVEFAVPLLLGVAALGMLVKSLFLQF